MLQGTAADPIPKIKQKLDMSFDSRRMSSRLEQISSQSKLYYSLIQTLVNTIPVMDVVKAYKRNKNAWGIDGYDFPQFNVHLDKV